MLVAGCVAFFIFICTARLVRSTVSVCGNRLTIHRPGLARQALRTKGVQGCRWLQTAHFSDRGRWFQRDRGRCFRVIVDDHGSTRVKGSIVV